MHHLYYMTASHTYMYVCYTYMTYTLHTYMCVYTHTCTTCAHSIDVTLAHQCLCWKLGSKKYTLHIHECIKIIKIKINTATLIFTYM